MTKEAFAYYLINGFIMLCALKVLHMFYVAWRRGMRGDYD